MLMSYRSMILVSYGSKFILNIQVSFLYIYIYTYINQTNKLHIKQDLIIWIHL